MRKSLMMAAAMAAVLGAPGVVRAQDSLEVRPVIDETFTIPFGQFVRAFLASGETYRVEISGRGLQLRVAPVQSGVQNPLVQPLLLGESPGGTVLYTVKPRADAVYEFRSVGGETGRAVTVRVTREKRPKRGRSPTAAGHEGLQRTKATLARWPWRSDGNELHARRRTTPPSSHHFSQAPFSAFQTSPGNCRSWP